jgi:hypothetical protein
LHRQVYTVITESLWLLPEACWDHLIYHPHLCCSLFCSQNEVESEACLRESSSGVQMF